jgi:tetratricopeptide (TPR) repeat protein
MPSALSLACTRGLLVLRRALPALACLLPAWGMADVYTDAARLVQAEQWPQARALTQTHLAQHPRDPQMLLILSQVQDGQGETQAAVATLESLTQAFPELPEPHNNLAVLYARQGRHEQALLALQAAVRARADYPVALENLGDLHTQLALQAYQQALKSSTEPQRVRLKIERAEQLIRTQP